MKEQPILPPPSPSPQQLSSFQKKNTTRPFQAAGGRDPIPFQKEQPQRRQQIRRQQAMEQKANASSPLLPLIRHNPHGLVAIPSKDQRGQQPIKSAASAVLQQNKHTSSSDGSIRANQSGNNVGIHNPCKQDTKTTMSTATTTTTTASSSSSCCDIYDAMIGEINDLLQAAHQAQTLGRLKMASTYLLLAHARLVGLGKRFDSILMVQPPPPPPPPIIQSQQVSQSQIQSYPQPLQQQQQQQPQQLQQLQQSYTLGNGATSKAPRILNLTMDSPSSMDLPYPHGNGNHEHRNNCDSNQELPSSQNIHTTPTTTTITSSSSGGSNSKPMTNNNVMYRNVHSTEPPSRVIQEAQKTLAKILPTEVHLDTTMMEHLARAAMELHNKRTGRGMLQERSHKVSSSSPPPPPPFSSSSTSSVVKRSLPGGVAWTDEEKKKCLLAAQMYGSGNVDAIAAHVGSRTAGEVKAHLKNVNERGKIERQITGTDGAHGHDQDDGDDHDNEEGEDELEDRRHYHQTHCVDADKGHGDVGSGKKRKMSHMIGSDGSRCKSGDGDEMSCSPASSSKRSRGTRNKAPSKAMLTLPHAVFDAKKMVSGKL